MSGTTQFTGLPMPIFTAFGWAGEENAIKFALEHLDVFIRTLHDSLSVEAKTLLPFWGVNKEAQTVYLAANADPERGPYIAFYARPLSFEMRIAITDRATINRGLKVAEKDQNRWHQQLTHLGENWHLHIQQMHVDEESGAVSFYQDLFKDAVFALDPDSCASVTSRAAFLNSEAKWVTPVFMSYRIDSGHAAGMSTQLISVVQEELEKSLPLVAVFSRQQKAAAKSQKGTGRTKKSSSIKRTVRGGEATTKSADKKAVKEEAAKEFSYVALLKKLHLRKGFINMTAKHWPFFAKTARTETRAVTVYYDGRYDKSAAVWRLQPDNVARLVLGDESQRWLESNFSPESKISIHVIRMEENEIQIRLQAVDG